jgi:hypothetical protein
MVISPQPLQVLIWPVDQLIFYARNPRKNDAAGETCSVQRIIGGEIGK